MNLKKMVKPQIGIELDTAIDDDNNVQDKTMEEHVVETNEDDIIDEDIKE